MSPHPRIRIHTDDDHERISHRIGELADAAPGSRDEAELMDLLDAVESWHVKKDDRADWT